MATMTLTFNLDDPSEARAAMRAMKAQDIVLALWVVQNDIFRRIRKYQSSDSDELTKLLEQQAVVDAIGLVEKLYYQCLEDHGVSTEELE